MTKHQYLENEMKPRNSIELQISTITFGLMLASIVWIVLVLSEGKGNAEPPPGYHLVFDEEFNGPLDVAPRMGWGSGHKWLAHTPNALDFGDAWFTGPGEPKTGSPFSVANGVLTIRAWKDPLKANHWRSGLLSSVDTQGNGFSQALGYWECRMLCPSGPGVWPGFWLDGITSVNRKRTTNSVEIDVLEAFGVDMTIAHQHVHVWSPGGKDVGGASSSLKLAGMTSGMHVYGCLVKTDKIHFYFDGKEVWVTPTPPEALEPLYCMVDLALGGDWPITQTPDPSRLSVDYVRVYAP